MNELTQEQIEEALNYADRWGAYSPRRTHHHHLVVLSTALRDSNKALRQACTNLATIRPLDVLQPYESDVTIGECAERWETLVREQSKNG